VKQKVFASVCIFLICTNSRFVFFLFALKVEVKQAKLNELIITFFDILFKLLACKIINLNSWQNV